ncbi:hypothetical protein ACFY1B_31935 [Streptomyces mirabilis]|uniref:hypothetical protein n=1 Tax=Streptomyces mirabilis TaxID=68239 RepID=UPI0036BE5B44
MATLIAVNVGMPKDVAWHGETIRTGVSKHPVAGSLMARSLDPDGNGQGSGAAYWVLKDSTRYATGYWAEEFANPYKILTDAGHEA